MMIEAKVGFKLAEGNVEEYAVEGNVETGEDVKELVYKLIDQLYDRYKLRYSISMVSIKEDGLYWPYIHFEDADTQVSFKVYLTKKEVI